MKKIILSVLFFLCCYLMGFSQTFNNATGGTIPLGTEVCFPITVSGVGNINGTYGLASVCLNLTYTWDADMEIVLKDPLGNPIQLSIQNGGSGDNYTNTCFTMSATANIVTATAPFTGNFLPNGNLGVANNGQNANGVWTLCVKDITGGEPVAALLQNWSITFNNTPAPPIVVPSNDSPCSAITLTPASSCTYAVYTNANATPTAGVPAPGCAGYSGGDVWFQVTVPPGGILNFDMQEGVMTDGGMALYTGTSCSALTLLACDDNTSANGNMPKITRTGLVPGTNIWIRVWENGNNNNGTFGICVNYPPGIPSCSGNAPAGNTCASATAVCNFSGYCGNTSAAYTADTWTQLSNIFCGSIDNNSFITFVASATSASFNVWVTSSTNDDGIQMMFYEGGCGPGAAVTLHGCVSPIAPLAGGTGAPTVVNATNLTIGSTYYLMFDGWANDVCDYVVDPINGVAVLAVTPPNASVCAGQSVTLTASGGNGTYTWTPAAGLNTTTGAVVIATPDTTTTYTLTSSTGLGTCPLTKTVTVNVTNTAPPPVVLSPLTICQNSTTAPLTATGTALLWYTDSIGGTGTATAPTPISTTVGSDTFYVTQTLVCGESPRVKIIVNVVAALSATINYPNSPYCRTLTTGQLVTLTGATGGSFSALPSGLDISSFTGTIWPSTSSAGPYTVTYLIPATASCPAFTTTATLTITAAPSATLSYTSSVFCTSLTTPQPATITGTTGGTFTATPAGLSINPTTGAITPSTSTAGPYTVTYTIAASGGCAAVIVTIPITIATQPAATISYSNTVYCTTVTTPQSATITGTTGGAFSASPAGLSINTTTGAITPSTSSPGGYTVTYTIVALGGCSLVTTTASVTITAAATATISYAGTPYCKSLTTAQAVTFTGTTGGTYTATPAGLTLDPATGAIIPSTSTAATYTVTYTIAATGGCSAVTATAPVTITNLPTAAISYTGTIFCTSLTTPQPATLTGTTGGVYSATPAGLSLNATTGAITPSTSGSGTYTVTYTIAASGGCAIVTATAPVTISTNPAATISYGATPYCTSLTTAQPATVTGTTGGTFTALPAGLTIDPVTGGITPSASTGGNYTVTYTIAAAGGCSLLTTTAPLTITQLPTATINYAGAPFCASVTSAQSVTLTGTTGGVFSAVPAGLSLNTSTGAIVPSTSAIDNYTVTYTIAAAAGCAAVTATAPAAITSVSTPPTVTSPVNYCQGNVAVPLTATGTNLLWYTTPTLGTGSPTAPTPSTVAFGSTTYYVTQNVSCGESARTPLVVNVAPLPVATINYAGSPYCSSLSTPQSVTQTGTSGGTYSAVPAGLSIDATTGAVTPATSNAGTYTVTYTIASAGGCAVVTATATVTVTTLPVATINYTGSPYCKSLTTPQAVTQTGTTGGVYSATPAGLSLNTTTGEITPSTSLSGLYTVTYTIAAAGGCAVATASTPVNITTLPAATISYSSAIFCTSLATPQAVTQTGTTGGVYSAAPGGLTIDPVTGAITPSTSTGGLYTITYTIAANAGCAVVTSTTTVTISTIPTAAISYTGSIFCVTLTSPQAVTLTGTTGGVYSATPAGLSINPLTGAITPNTSTANTYTVTYTIAAAGGCSMVTATTPITISTIAAATISYPATPYCSSLTTPQAVTQTGTTGGTYTAAPAGLNIDATTGAVIPGVGTAGNYVVTYTIAAIGGCASVTTTTNVAITALPVASISYGATPYCSSLSTPQAVTQTGTTGGVYTATPAGLTINAGTGEIIPATSIPQTYTVTYTIASAGGCAAVTANTSVTITLLPVATINYASTPYCNSLSGAQTVTQTGSTGGVFSATPAGLTLDPTTGSITPSTSTASVYNVTYTIAAAAGCAAVTAVTPVTVTALPAATISYGATPYCTSLTSSQAVTFTGTTGGVYTALPAGLTIDPLTGAIIPATSNPGGYTVTYTIAAAGGCGIVTATAPVTIALLPTAVISYSATPYCSSITTAQPVTLTGNSGGVYTALPVGLTISSTTGDITPSTSTAGTYTVTYTIAAAGGCSVVTATTSVTITTLPTATISYAATPYCSSLTTAQAVTFTGTPGGLYSSLPAGLLLNAANGGVNPSLSTASSYVVDYFIAASGGCPAVSASAPITISTLPVAAISYSSAAYCTAITTPQLVNQTGNTGGLYTSVPAGLKLDSLTGTIKPDSSTANAYTVSYTIAAANGCGVVTATTPVTIIQTPAAPVAADVNYCQFSGAAPLTATATGSLLWYNFPFGGTGVAAVTPLTTATGSTVYYVSQTVNGCEGLRDTLTINVAAAPNLGFDQKDTVCFGGFTNLNTKFDTTGFVSWTVAGSTVSNPDSVTLSGNYLLTVANASGCRDSAYVYFQVLPKVVAYAGQDTTAIIDQATVLHAYGAGPGGSYNWFSWAPSTAVVPNPNVADPIMYLHDFHYTFKVEVKNILGCADTASVKVMVLQGPNYYVPTSFSPDGVNKIFRPIPVGVAFTDWFRIYNRYGEEVFATNKWLEGWDGNYKGKKQPMGTYAWILKGTDRGGRIINMSGTVVLLR